MMKSRMIVKIVGCLLGVQLGFALMLRYLWEPSPHVGHAIRIVVFQILFLLVNLILLIRARVHHNQAQVQAYALSLALAGIAYGVIYVVTTAL